MCTPTVAMAVGTIGSIAMGVSTYQDNQAKAEAADYQSQIYRQNAQIAEQNAVNERQAGYNEADRIEMATAQKRATQVAAMAANGIDTDEGTAADLTDTTQYYGEMDALTTVKNANSRAFAYESEGQNYLMQADLSSMQAKNYRSNSLLAAAGDTLTGLGQVKSTWGTYTKTKTSLPSSKTLTP